MLMRFHIVLVCIATMIAIPSARADDVPRTPQAVPSELARLLHKDTVAFVYISSAVEFAQSLQDMASHAYPKGADAMKGELNATSLLGSLVLTKNKIMVDQPIGIGYWGTEADNDMPYVVVFRVEGASPQTVMAKGKGRRLMFLEGTDWVAVSNASASWSPAPANAPRPSIVENMLPGQCAVSFDQAAWLGSASEQSINAQLKTQLKGSFDAAMEEAVISLIDDYVHGFTRWDFAVEADDGDLTFDARYVPTADSRFAITGTPDLVQLGHRLPGQLAFQSVISTAYMTTALEITKPLVIAQAGKDRQLARTLLDDMSRLIATQSVGSGLSIGMSEYGLDLAQILRVDDAAQTLGLIDEYIEDINAAKAGVHYKRMRVLVGGDSSRLWEVTFDKKEMKEANPALAALVDADFMEMVANLDEGKMYLRVISNGNWMAVVAGEPKLLGRMRRALSQPSAFNPNLDHIGANTEGDLVMAMSLDLRSLFNGMLAYVHAHPSEIKKEWRSMNARNVISQLKPIPGPPAAMSMSVASAADGSVMSSFVFDVQQIGEMCWTIYDNFMNAAMADSTSTPVEKSDK